MCFLFTSINFSFIVIEKKKTPKPFSERTLELISFCSTFNIEFETNENYLVRRNICDVIRSPLNNLIFIFLETKCQQRNDSQLKNYAVCIQAIYTQWWFHIIHLINSEVVFRRIFFSSFNVYISIGNMFLLCPFNTEILSLHMPPFRVFAVLCKNDQRIQKMWLNQISQFLCHWVHEAIIVVWVTDGWTEDTVTLYRNNFLRTATKMMCNKLQGAGTQNCDSI